ncbi:MAG: MerR family transcriptional regulator [Actinobacteria bacterium]|nr:MerR family transcriptional regulator [Actinomycetota bacterium]MBO0786759.1 MerR family transcriptional regulator [Actinomycetota bacterium]
MAGLTIGKFAAGAGVGVETVRFYQRRGLLPRPERSGSGFREYTEADRQRLAFIRRARQLGFTLGEISDLLGPAEGRSAAEISRAAEAKLAAVGEQIAELALLRCRLRRLVRVCEQGDRDDCVALQLGDAVRAAGNDHFERKGLVGELGTERD